MSKIPDFTDSELRVVRDALRERYGRDVEPDAVDTELRLDPGDRELTACPALYWKEEGCNFVICKSGRESYRAQFFYRGHEQFGTGIEEYDDIIDCVMTLLQVQADHESRRRGAFPEATE